ncbi:MAG: aryl-sulfate sulfotransferase [bacterium]
MLTKSISPFFEQLNSIVQIFSSNRKYLGLILLTFVICTNLNIYAQAFTGYTLYSPNNSRNTYLIDMNKTVVHSWSHTKTGGYSCYLLEDGSLMRSATSSNSQLNGGGATGIIQKVAWNGSLLWEYTYSSSTYRAHHDFAPMPNGNVLIIAWEVKTAAQAVQAGLSRSNTIWPDHIIEVQPNGTTGGTIVWQWHAWDHLIQNYNPLKDNYGVVADHPELLNINVGSTGSGDWMHVNGISYNPELDQIAFSSHNLDEVYVIDHSTTTAEAASHSGGIYGKGGDYLYRWGCPSNYGVSGSQVFSVVHCATWIPAGYPGAGNIMAFNNRENQSTSMVVEIVPPSDGAGNYTYTSGTAFGPVSPVWSYTASGFYSQHLGGCQRLPNGNTFIVEATTGVFWEVNSAGTVVWNYNKGGEIARGLRYAPSYPGIAINVTPLTTQLNIGETVTLTATKGFTPYVWWVVPSGLGTISSSGSTAAFTAVIGGTGKIYVSSYNGLDTASAEITVTSPVILPKLPPSSLNSSKGKYSNKIELSWITSGEFEEGFEDIIPTSWKYNLLSQNCWTISKSYSYVGNKCLMFKPKNENSLNTDWLITQKIYISAEKPIFRFAIKADSVINNNLSSYINISTTDQSPASFTTTLLELSPEYLQDSVSIWKIVNIDLTNYIGQYIYLGFYINSNKITLSLDNFCLIGQTGITPIGQLVQNYNLYRSTTMGDLQNTSNVIFSGLTNSYTDVNIEELTKYYYGVSAVYENNNETEISAINYGISYLQNDSLIIEDYSETIPIIDGIINSYEYTDAILQPLTNEGYQSKVLLKTADNKLFLAVDCFSDSILNVNDYVLFVFDKNRNNVFDDLVEGYYQLINTTAGQELSFYPYNNFGFYEKIVNPEGVVGVCSLNNNHVQYEFSFDFTNSLLIIPDNKIIGAFISSFNSNSNINSNWLEYLSDGIYSVNNFGTITFNSLVNVKSDLNNPNPKEFVLNQNYPNPFNPSTTITFGFPTETHVSLKVYDITGREIAIIINDNLTAGYHSVNFNLAALGKISSGVYFYRLSAGNFNQTKQMLLLK